MAQVDITLLVCTHNNASVLARALDSIARQNVLGDTTWEVLIVDNNCEDHTLEVTEQFRHDSRIPKIRVMSESRQGVAYARKTGIAAAEGRLVAFVDDDCFLAEDWIESAIEFANLHPHAGAFGGRNDLVWEERPADWCVAYGESLAQQALADHDLLLPREGRRVPCGAGLVILRDALLASGYLELGMLRGRDPVRLGAGEDTEIVLFIRRAGYEIWYTPSLRLQHYIPKHRTSLHYLCRLHRGFGRAESQLQILATNRRPTLLNRIRAVGSAIAGIWPVMARFPMGYVYYENERPSWWFRWNFAVGNAEGALWRLFESGSSGPASDRSFVNADALSENRYAASEDHRTTPETFRKKASAMNTKTAVDPFDLEISPRQLKTKQVTPEQFRLAAFLLHTRGYVVLKSAVPSDVHHALANEFAEVYQDCVSSKNGDAWYQVASQSQAVFWERNFRWRIFPKLRGAFSDPWILANPFVMPILRFLLGAGMFCKFVSSDTCTSGAEMQSPHRELGVGKQWAPCSYVVNIPLCSCRSENGPLEVWPGSGHLWQNDLLEQLNIDTEVQDDSNRDFLQLAAVFPSTKLTLDPGDILVRDPGLLHRGTVNQTAIPRTMMTLCYFRAGHWHDYGDIQYNLNLDMWRNLADDVRSLFSLDRAA